MVSECFSEHSSFVQSTTIGRSLSMRNRVVMGSITRNSCIDDNKPAVTDAVNKEGGKVFFQAWHVGCIQHDQMPVMRQGAAEGGIYRDLPDFWHTDNIQVSKDPGKRANKRTDRYGGSVENRCRFILELVDTISSVLGSPELIFVKINLTDIYDSYLIFGPLVKYPGSSSLLMANSDYAVDNADRLMADGELDLITFTRPFTYNPYENYNDWHIASI
ncbi:hypothetical protein BDW71DRAFT_197777 [Aspergillus fruticulosus]